MSIQAEEAASTLKDAEAAAGRAEAAHGYRIASGFLILWGVIWTVGNLVTQVSPHAGQTAWMIGALIGMAGSAWMGSRQSGRQGKGGSLKAVLVALAIGGFGACVSIVSPAMSFAQGEAVACLAVGAIYVAMGASGGGLRLSVVGAAIMIGTVVGWSFARDQFFLWMAAVGGGGLILGGLWMRKV